MRTVPKTATEVTAFHRPSLSFANARSALGAVFKGLGVPDRGGVLLPSYIGWSPREGSGVFDPVRQLEAPYWFYSVNRNLRFDPKEIARMIRLRRPRVLLLIHYFGWPDPSAAEAAKAAQAEGVAVVEDEAHAMYSDLVGGVCGRYGDAAVFSLHKMLPVTDGGLLMLNRHDLAVPEGRNGGNDRLGGYDLAQIARVRIRNAQVLTRLISRLSPAAKPLWDDLPEGVVPQTFPIVLESEYRDRVYDIMNANGLGVVSLYHTMISEMSQDEFADAHWLSRHILNLPVHQDVREEDLAPLVQHLSDALAEAER